MNDIKTKLGGGKMENRNQLSVSSNPLPPVGRRAATPVLRPACGTREDGPGGANGRAGDDHLALLRCLRPCDLPRLSPEMLMFLLQKLAPEKYGRARLWGNDESR